MRSWSLKTKISLAVACLVFFVLGLFSLFCFSFLENSLKAKISSQQFVLVSEIAKDLDTKLAMGRTIITETARAVPPDILKRPEKMRDFLRRNLGAGTRLFFDTGIFLFSPSGRLLGEIPEKAGRIAQQATFRRYFVRTARTGKPGLSPSYFSGRTHRHPVIMFTAPVRDARNRIVAVLGGAVDLLKDNFLGILSSVRIGKTGYLSLFDQNQTLLIQSDRERIQIRKTQTGSDRGFARAVRGFEGTDETVTRGGLRTLTSFKRLEETGWILGAHLPLAEAYAPVYREERFLGAALVVTLAFSVLLAWLFLKHLTAPLLLFTSHVREITGEEERPPLIGIRSEDEIGTLAQAFNRMLIDVDRKKSALENQKRFSESLIQSSSVPTLVLNCNHQVVGWNRACENLTGIRAEEVIGTREHWRAFYDHERPLVADLVLEGRLDDLSHLYANQRRSPHSPEGLETEGWLISPGGEKHYIIFDAAPIRNDKGEIVAAIETIRDITALKKSEESFKEAHSLLAATLESTADGILALDRQDRVTACNRKFLDVWGMPKSCPAVGTADLMREIAKERMQNPDDFLAQSAALRASPEKSGWGTIQFKEGQTVAYFSKPQRIDRRTVGRVMSFRDITDQRAAEAAEKRRQLLLEAATESFLRFLQTGSIHQMATAMLERCLEISGADLGLLYDLEPGNQVRLLAVSGSSPQGKDPEAVIKAGRKIEQDGEVTIRSSGRLLHAPATLGETVLWHEDKDPFPLSLRFPQDHPPIHSFLGVPLKIGTEIVGVIALANKAGGFSETDRKEMESFGHTAALAIQGVRTELARQQATDQLHVVQKFEAIGQLAGGIAHDFNNLLTVINGYSTHLLRALARDDPRHADAELVLQAGQRAAALTRQLLAFSRRQVLEPQVLELNMLIHAFAKILKRFLREDIDFIFSPGEDVGPVKADPGQLEQVLLNLVVNARDAMPKGGKISLRTEEAVFDDAFVRENRGAVPGNYVMLSVSDSGTGMSEEIKNRVFEPFFTTKEQGRGTGLGLSTVFGIVKQSSGYILLESTPGEGTCFKIFLPRTEEAPVASLKKPTETLARGRGTVLLVEDELAVLHLVEQALREYGFTVLKAQSPGEALERLEAFIRNKAGNGDEQGKIDLLVTDMVMPEMSGTELAAALEEKVPGIKTLYMSGYGQFHGRDAVPPEVIRAFLQKPFTPDALLEKVRGVLG